MLTVVHDTGHNKGDAGSVNRSNVKMWYQGDSHGFGHQGQR